MIVSVSGLRGVVGEDLDAGVARRWGAAFGRVVGRGPILVGRDARPSGVELSEALIEGIASQGVDVLDAGLCSTPTLEVGVVHLGASGGVMVTASHNPSEYNGLKFFGSDGIIVGPQTGRNLACLSEEELDTKPRPGTVTPAGNLTAAHVQKAAQAVDVRTVQCRKFKAVLDGCSSVGGPVLSALLDRLGCGVVEIDCAPTGNFTRSPEPRAEALGALSDAIREHGADIGFAVDPDGDRLCVAAGDGTVLSEEYTVPLVAMHVLSGTRGEKVVVNLSTSRMIDDVAAGFGASVLRCPVGERNVVRTMAEAKAIVGGEGNGGAMVPAVNPSRDAVVGAAYILALLATEEKPLTHIVSEIPAYAMVKDKVAAGKAGFDDALPELRKIFDAPEFDTSDGLRASWPDKWVHIRPSGTEPIVRVFAEAADEETAAGLIDTARGVIRSPRI